MTTMPLLYTSPKGETSIHNYNEDEIAEVFGPEATGQLFTHGVTITADGGIWVDMLQAATKRTAQVQMAKDAAQAAAKRRDTARQAHASIRRKARQ